MEIGAVGIGSVKVVLRGNLRVVILLKCSVQSTNDFQTKNVRSIQSMK